MLNFVKKSLEELRASGIGLTPSHRAKSVCTQLRLTGSDGGEVAEGA